MTKKKWMSLAAIAFLGTSLQLAIAEEPEAREEADAIDKVLQSKEQDLVSELNENSPVAQVPVAPAVLSENAENRAATSVETIEVSHIGYGNGQFYQTYDGPLYRTFTAFEGKPGTNRSLGDIQLVVPLWEESDSLIFADLRGRIDDSASSEGNWGLGWRQIQDNSWIAGAYAFYDLRRTEFDNNFSQATIGLEALSVEWEARINGYIPETKSERVSALNTAQIQNGNVVVLAGIERAFYGVDAEVGALLQDWNDGDLELRGFIGAFHFDTDAAGFQNISGPRARLELRGYDVPWLGTGSRLTVGGEYQYDDVRDSQFFGMARLRIPLRPGRQPALTRLQRRMMDRVIRDVDIVAIAQQGIPEPAKVLHTVQPISDLLFVNGNTVNPEAFLEGAPVNSLVIADGSFGAIAPAGTVEMPNGQSIVGGGSNLRVVGCNTGAEATLTAPGTRPTLNSSFVMSNGGSLNGLNINGQGTTAAVRVNGTGSFQVINSMITNDDNANTNNVLLPDGSTNVDIAEIGIFASGFSGDLVTRDTTVTSPDDALFLSPSGTEITIADSSFTATGNGGGLDMRLFDDANVTANFTGSTFIGADAGIQNIKLFDNSSMSATFANATIAGFDAFAAGIDDIEPFDNSNLTIDFTDSTITGIGDDGVESLESFGTSKLVANFTRTMIIGGQNGSDEGFDDIRANDMSSLTFNITDSTVLSLNNDPLEDLQTVDNGTLVANIVRTTLTNGGNGAFKTDEGIDTIASYDTSSLTVNIVDSMISATLEAVEDLEARGASTLTATISGTTLFATEEAIRDLETSGTSRLTVSILNSTLTSSDDIGIGTVSSSSMDSSSLTAILRGNTITAGIDAVRFRAADTSTFTLDATNNVLSSGAGAFDFNLSQGAGSTFNVVNLPGLGGNNNSASVNVMGTITNIPALP